MRDCPTDLQHRLRQHGQEHLLAGWESLSASERQALVDQLAGVDLREIEELYRQRDEKQAGIDESAISPVTMNPHHAWTNADRARGDEALAKGEVAVILVAGGQGSRLGFDKPKGMFPIGPVSNKSLFQIHAEKLFALSRRYGKPIPFLVMTSPATDADTQSYFAQNRCFGLPESEVFFFQQGTMPAVDLETGRLLLEKPGVLFASPNGHGGTLTALADTGLLEIMRQRGIRSFFYFQVDNPLVKIAEPLFLGQHLALRAEASSKAIEKAYPGEKMGVFALINNRLGIIEYSDMPEALLNAAEPGGRLLHRAGNPAIHLFDIDFLTRVTQGATRLPWHLARKKVPYVDANGRTVQPTRENALKFGMFVFDALPLAERWLAQEALRQEEFSPVKNADGVDSPATARRDLINLHAGWLEHAGVAVPRDDKGNALIPVEVSPRFALDAAELGPRLSTGRVIERPTYFE
jgi:UDP-N-acetylglucosamine/UDP-N-acetylgalactosamine diphosphorylase